jgi:bacteriorhodopsin
MEVFRMFWFTGILGILLVIAPFVLGFMTNPMAMWSSIILGLLIVIVSGVKAAMHDAARWEYWVAGILGILSVVAPFVLGFSALHRALITSIVLGFIVVLLAGYQLFTPHQQTPAK